MSKPPPPGKPRKKRAKPAPKAAAALAAPAADALPPVPPSTIEFLRYHAAAKPDAPALVHGGGIITYGRFSGDLNRFGHVLAGYGLAPGSLVVVECDDIYIHWLLMLACELLGLVSGAYTGSEQPAPPALVERAALVLHQGPAPPVRDEGGALAEALSREWLDRVQAADDSEIPEHPTRMDDVMRVRRSSGTTGTPKLMPAPRSRQERGIEVFLYESGMTSRSRFLVFNNFSVGAIHLRAALALRLGATVMTAGRLSAAEAIERLRPTHIRLLNAEATALLRELPADFSKPEGITVLTGGSPMSPLLRGLMLERIASRLVVAYGSNETGAIGMLDEHDIATALPDVEVEVIDEAGSPVPVGTVGQIRLRIAGIVDHYLDDEQTTAAKFRDGWFYPGDAGTMVAPRRFRVLGRIDEVMNIGGLKLLPAEVEGWVRDAAPGIEVAVTPLLGEMGDSEICVALVLAPDQEFVSVVEKIRAKVPGYLGRLYFAQVKALPRNEAGKVSSAELKALFARAKARTNSA